MLEALEDRVVLDNTFSVGADKPLDVSPQPSLALQFIINANGHFPTRAGGAGAQVDEGFLGEVLPFAGTTAPNGWFFCDGQLLPLSQNEGLFSLLGANYGGDGISNFALPDLRGRAAVGADGGALSVGEKVGPQSNTLSLSQVPQHAAALAKGGSTGVVGGSQPLDLLPSLALNYLICVNGSVPLQGSGGHGSVPFAGEIVLFAGNFAPDGWAFCDGQTLQISQNSGLFAVLGPTYGGDGTTTFGLPDLRGRSPLGTGQGTGLSNVALGQELGIAALSVADLPIHNYPLPPTGAQTTGSVGGGQPFTNIQPALGLNYIITNLGANDTEPIVGDIRLFAGSFAPDGWSLCDGQSLSSAQFPALSTLLGTTYGSAGSTTFVLPDLRGRAALEAGQGIGLSGHKLGDSFGQEQSIQLTIDQLPPESLPLPVLGLTVISRTPLVIQAGATAGFTVTVNNTGPSPSVAAAATLIVPLPVLGGGNVWRIDNKAPDTNPSEFVLRGTVDNQVLELIGGAALKSNTPEAVTVTGVTTSSTAPLRATAVLDSPDVTDRNLTVNSLPTLGTSPESPSAKLTGAIYQDVLGRQPSSADVSFWVAALNGGVTRLVMAQAIWESPEHRGIEIDQYYGQYFNRAADPAGRAYWVTLMGLGVSETAVGLQFLSSPEYALAHPTLESYLIGLYQDVFGRVPDLGGVLFWQAQSGAGASRTQLASGFLTSPEAYIDWLNISYTKYLGRLPDAFGVATLLTALESGQATLQSVAEGILASDELFARGS